MEAGDRVTVTKAELRCVTAMEGQNVYGEMSPALEVSFYSPFLLEFHFLTYVCPGPSHVPESEV